MELAVGKGQKYETLGAALRALEEYGDGPAKIRLFPGRYHEKVEIRRSDLIIEGENARDTVVTYDDYANALMPDGEKRGTFRSYTMLIDAPRVTLRRLTVENEAALKEGSGQAIALYAEGEGIVVEDCRLLGGQDTLFTGPLPPKEIVPGGFRGPKEFAPRINGRQYYKNTYICGTVDFIFGSATAFFEGCTLESVAGRSGYVTAGSSPEGQKYGYVFENCHFIGEGAPGSVYLGRPWRDYARVVILHSYLGAHIRPEGWHDWKKQRAHETAFFAEYENEGPGAAGDRVPWARKLTAREAQDYTKQRVLGCPKAAGEDAK